MGKEVFIAQLIQIAKMIADTFGPNCETLIHDFGSYDNFILAIFNGHVSGRKVGDIISVIGKKISPEMFSQLNTGVNYVNRRVETMNGKILKSSTLFFAEDGYSLALAINFDITSFASLGGAIDGLIATDSELMTDLRSDQSMDAVLTECLALLNIPIEQMGMNDRKRLVAMLDERNVFKLQKSVPYIADRLHVSRFTIYNYLRELRAESAPANE